ncbi:transcription cofactor vestigial-like protein 2 [Haliotis cracherodii]|uniref:transcription cofactor vestigial-like protein 2 n=1 Tax=Haliotis cracherodii TaxID=6455 RepID=UPI0039E9DE7B
MSCVDIMYQPYSTGFPYQRTSSEAVQAFSVPRMHEPLDLGSYTASASASSAVKEEDLEKDLQPKETHYLNANCVLLTYFTGDTSTVVDEHFTRALNQPSSFGSETHAPKNLISKDCPPMSQRNFPPSFWNSAYQPSPSLSHHDFQFSANPYFSTSLHGISGLHQDPWHYSLSSQTHSYPHRTMHYDLSYPSMAGSSRFSPNYGSLLMNPSMRTSQFGSMSGQCDISKASDPSRPRYPDPRLGTEFSTHASLPGLESSIQEAGKDLYWF